MAKAKDNNGPLTVEVAKSKGPIDVESIDPAKNYRAVVQLGAKRRWRQYGCGRWVRQADTFTEDGKRIPHWKHEPSLHETGPISGGTLRGLAVHHNEWLKDNATRRVIGNDSNHRDHFAGDLNRQLLIVDYSQTDEALPTVTRVGSPAWVEQVVRATVKAMVELKQT